MLGKLYCIVWDIAFHVISPSIQWTCLPSKHRPCFIDFAFSSDNHECLKLSWCSMSCRADACWGERWYYSLFMARVSQNSVGILKSVLRKKQIMVLGLSLPLICSMTFSKSVTSLLTSVIAFKTSCNFVNSSS